MSTQISPEPLFLQAKQSCLSQLLLTRLKLQAISDVFLWTCSNISTTFLKWGAQNWTWHLRCSLTCAEYEGTIVVFLATLFLIQARRPLAFLDTWAHTGSSSGGYWLTPTRLFIQGNFPATFLPACSTPWGCELSAGPFTLPCWTSCNWSLPINLVCPDPFAETSSHQTEQHSHPNCWHLQIKGSFDSLI